MYLLQKSHLAKYPMLKVGLLILANAFIVTSPTRLMLHPFLALLWAAFAYELMAQMSAEPEVAAVNAG